MNSSPDTQSAEHSFAFEQPGPRLALRHRRERRFRLIGRSMIFLAFAILAFLLISITSKGYTAFWQTTITLPIAFDEQIIDPEGTRETDTLRRAYYAKLIQQALSQRFPEASGRRERRQLFALTSNGAPHQLRDMVIRNPSLIGQTHEIALITSSDVDMFAKGRISRDIPQHERRLTDLQIMWLDMLKQDGSLSSRFNTTFFTEGDSREPEMAGMLGSIIGSLFTIAACLFVAFPLAVMTAIFLEEFAPKNRLTDWIEVNINNLAAVPSIIFGLLGLGIYLNLFGMPRSSSLAGGMTLALMILPTIIISTRTSLRSVPSSIRDAARGLGASPLQVVLHHSLPLAMPGIMTGTILGTARALGETAPLLMIGMVAFVADIPGGFLDPATAMPVQVYLWSDSPELGFTEKTSACIMVLLAILVAINATAVYVRRKFERRW